MNSALLKSKRVAKGLMQDDIARELNITVASYSNKENRLNEFKRSEIKKLIDLLVLSESDVTEIFFDDETV
jgi:transcriptional regulator with XRE-family HTH domain